MSHRNACFSLSAVSIRYTDQLSLLSLWVGKLSTSLLCRVAGNTVRSQMASDIP